MELRRVRNRHIQAVLATLVATVVVLYAAQPAQSEPPGLLLDEDRGGHPYVAGELLVTYEQGAPEAIRQAIPEQAGGEVEEKLVPPDAGTAPDVELVEFPEIKGRPSEEDREQALARRKDELAAKAAVSSVDYNYVRSYSFVPNDDRFRAQWGLRKPGFPDAWNDARGVGLRIGVIDSGISGHPDLEGKVVAQRDFAHNDARAEDNVGHGTLVSGVVAAATHNRLGIAGGCFQCKLLVAKDGEETATDAASIKGIYWSTNNGARAINISSGAYVKSGAYEDAVNYAWSRGVVVAASAGNEDASLPKYPAAYKNVISVSATDRFDRRAGFSNYGSTIDVAAPGVGILSTIPGGYAYADGTSFSAPHVAALAGLLRHQGLSAQEARARIQDTAKDLGPAGKDGFYGYGRINAAGAVAPR